MAERLGQDPELTGLAAYCSLREKGLRTQAFDALQAWLDSTARWPREKSRTVCTRILEASGRTRPDVFLSHPLLIQFIRPTLLRWIEDEPDAGTPHRWLGLLDSDAALLRRALELNPSDFAVRKRLVDFALGQVDYQTHHLYEDLFIGELDEALGALETAKELLQAAPDPERFADHSAEAAELEQLLADWTAYRISPEGTFIEWCEARGRSYGWSRTFYYTDDPDSPAQ